MKKKFVIAYFIFILLVLVFCIYANIYLVKADDYNCYTDSYGVTVHVGDYFILAGLDEGDYICQCTSFNDRYMYLNFTENIDSLNFDESMLLYLEYADIIYVSPNVDDCVNNFSAAIDGYYSRSLAIYGVDGYSGSSGFNIDNGYFNTLNSDSFPWNTSSGGGDDIQTGIQFEDISDALTQIYSAIGTLNNNYNHNFDTIEKAYYQADALEQAFIKEYVLDIRDNLSTYQNDKQAVIDKLNGLLEYIESLDLNVTAIRDNSDEINLNVKALVDYFNADITNEEQLSGLNITLHELNDNLDALFVFAGYFYAFVIFLLVVMVCKFTWWFIDKYLLSHSLL